MTPLPGKTLTNPHSQDPNGARDRAASDREGTNNAKGSASTLEGSYLAPSDWRDRDAIDASEGRVALASASCARVREMKGSRPNNGTR